MLMALMLFGLIEVSNAQQAPKMPTPQEMASKSVNELEKRLKLNPTQKGVIYNYTFDLCKHQLDLIKRQQAGTSNEDDVTKFYKMQNETNNSIKTVLKGEQLVEFDKVLEERASGIDPKKKKKKGKRGKEEAEEVSTGIEGLKSVPPSE
jgi:protein CpxP